MRRTTYRIQAVPSEDSSRIVIKVNGVDDPDFSAKEWRIVWRGKTYRFSIVGLERTTHSGHGYSFDFYKKAVFKISENGNSITLPGIQTAVKVGQ